MHALRVPNPGTRGFVEDFSPEETGRTRALD